MSETSLKDKAAKGFLWAAVNNGATQLLGAVFGLVLSRILDKGDYGLINMILVFSAIATALQDSGFVIALINKKDASHRDYNSVFWFNVIVSASLYLLLFFCAPLIAQYYGEPILTSLSRYFFICFFIASFSIVPRSLLMKQLRQKELAMMGLAALVVSNSIGLGMAFSGMAYWSLATQTITFNLTISILSWYFSGWKPSLKISFQPVREMFGFSVKMLITYIFNNINNNIFSLVLGKIYTKNEVGDYSQANKWNMMGANTISGMVNGVAQPTFVQVGDDKERLCRALSKMLRLTCFIAFPAMFGLALVSHEFIIIAVTEKWIKSAHLMQMLCIEGAFLPIATLYFNMIISRGKSDIYMWNIIVQGCLILAAILGVHFMGGGIDEMVWAHVGIVISWVAIWHIFVRREIGFSFTQGLKDILPFLLIAAGTMIATHFITRGIENLYILLASRIILAAVIYIGTLWILGANILRECLSYLIKKKK